MTEVYMEITGAVATARKVGPLTAGMVGVPVMFSFSPEWQELNLLAVFRAGEEKKDNEIKEGRSVIPAQVLTQPGQMLCIGVEGRSKDGALVIPTVWAEVGRILDGAQAANDPALAPTPTQFERFMAGLEQVDEKLQESLRQAKESGDFNGTSVTHRWEGTTLEVTSASGTSRAELKGEPGHTPVKGVDYFTEEDKQEFQEAVCVTCDHITGKCSHTLAQIQELAARGKIVTLKTSNNPEYTYYLQDTVSGLFMSLDPGGTGLNYYYASVNQEGDVDQHKNQVPIDAVRFYATQLLSEEFKARARDNIGAAAAAEAVKTVNGISPDAEGNVQIETGGVSSWDDMPAPMPGKFLPDNVAFVEKGILLGETDAVETTDPNFGKCWFINKAPMLTVGETYTVIYNGVPYDCVCQDSSNFVDGSVALGNLSVVGGANTGEPFAMMISYTQQTIASLDLTGAESVRIGIQGRENVLNVFVDTSDESNLTADKTIDEIWQAVKENKEVYLYLAIYICRLIVCYPGQCAVFAYPSLGSTSGKVDAIYGLYGVIVTQDGSVKMQQ